MDFFYKAFVKGSLFVFPVYSFYVGGPPGRFLMIMHAPPI